MKKSHLSIFPILTLVSILACNQAANNQSNQPKKETVPAFRAILNSADVTGAILIYDPAKNVYYSNDFTWCMTGHLPAPKAS
jgi:beta-lactamase class D